MTDMGRIPYYADKIYYDLWGLTNPETGRFGLNPKREFLRFPEYFVLVGFAPNETIELRFGREMALAYNETFHKAYKLLGIACADGADPKTPGYNYLIFQLDPEIPLPEIRKEIGG